MNVDFLRGIPGRRGKICFAGKLSPRNLEFSSSFRSILDKFPESQNRPWQPRRTTGNPLGPEKRNLRRGFQQSARAFFDPISEVEPAFLGKVSVKSQLLRADKTHFEPMAAVRERRPSQGIRRIKKPVGPG